MKNASTWLISVFRDEVRSAFILFAVTTATVAVSLSSASDHLQAFANIEVLSGHTLSYVVSEWLMCIFFLIAGIELRHELTLGSLASPRRAAVPALAALGGMAIPAVIFHAASPLPHFWGIAMPTDLPFALALIAIFGRHTSSEFRAFVLSLAIVDDALSVIAISAQSGNFAIHATLLAVIVGLLLPARVGEQFRHLLHPVSAGIVLPLFAITALSMPLNFSDFFSGESFWLGIARVAGKPIGVLLGAAIAIYIFRGLTKLSWNEIAVVGFVCSIGFSVSLLFASTATVSMSERAVVNAAIVLAIPVSAIAGGFALKSFGRNK